MGELTRFWKLPQEYEKILSPFEVDFERYLFERYQKNKSKNLNFFYAVKHLIPRFLQITLRRLRAKSIKNNFPHWPIEPYLEELKRKCLKYQKDIEKIPFIWFWPGNKNFSLCLTHDVETKEGFKKIERICKIEKNIGLRSAWFFVAEKYPVSENLIKELKEQGFEVGVHGLRHDGKLFNSKNTFNKRKEKLRIYAQKWNAKGFRSPSLLRNAQLIKDLPFEYDSSFPDTDPYGPQPGGCLSIFPFFMGNIVEIPVTMPQDHTLFVILRKRNISIWKKKVDWIEKMHGVALFIIHPDYFDAKIEKYYIELLDYLSGKKNVWFAQPLEICNWWRSRDRSFITGDENSNLTITGEIKKNGTIAQIGDVI